MGGLVQLPLLDWSLAKTKWKSILDPVLGNPLTNPLVLKNITLTTGTNRINHMLGVTQQGWFIVDIQAPASIYRNAPFDSSILSLHSSAQVVVSLAVF